MALPSLTNEIENENYGATPPAMSTPGSRAMTTVMLISVSAGMHFDGFGLLLCFVGVLVGGSLLAAGVRMTDTPAPRPIVPMVFGCAGALAEFVRRNTAATGFVIASGAVMVVSGHQDPVLCFGMFVLLLVGLTLINIGARDE